MKLTGSTAGLVGCSVQTIIGLACSATTNPTTTAAGLSFSNNDELSNFIGGACVYALLDPKERSLLAKGEINENDWSTTDKFKSPSGESKGCLAVSWDKQTWNDGYWKGTIRYEWLFTKGTETMVVHGFLGSEEIGINKNWKAVYINTQSDKKAWKQWTKGASSNHELEKKMPQRPTFFALSDDYWTFNPDYDKKCPKNKQCVGDSLNKHFESTWKWKPRGDGNHKFSDWSKNYSDVFNDELDSLKTVVEEAGTWESF